MSKASKQRARRRLTSWRLNLRFPAEWSPWRWRSAVGYPEDPGYMSVYNQSPTPAGRKAIRRIGCDPIPPVPRHAYYLPLAFGTGETP